MRRTGAELLVAELEKADVGAVFGLPGTQTTVLYEALRRSALRTVLSTSEAGAAFMAGGWARIAKRPGVLITIPGPGFAWALPGVAEAQLDSVPLVHISGKSPSVGGRHGQQAIDQAAVARPIVKATLEASIPSEMPRAVTEALRLASAGEPGPVLLEVSTEALAELADAPRSPASEALREVSAQATLDPDFRAILARFRTARRPVLLIGQGVVACASILRTFAERFHLPVVTTPSARGALPEDHQLAMGFDPLRSDIGELNAFLGEADLILSVGAKLGHNGSGGFRLRIPADRLIRVDTSAENVQANYPATCGLVAEARTLFAELALVTPLGSWPPADVAEWRSRLRRSLPLPLEPVVGGRAPGGIGGWVADLQASLARDTIVVLDSGLHQVLARRSLEVLEPDGLLFPSDLQSMGFGVPTAVGARLASGGRPVVAIVGDGGFLMTGTELLAAVRHRLDLVVIVLVDGQLGLIRRQQQLEYGTPFSVELGAPDVAGLAAALGARVPASGQSIRQSLRSALTEGGVSVLPVTVDEKLSTRLSGHATAAKECARRMLGAGRFSRIKRLFG